ncbi:MAG: signal recognition particle-docking protein FtsY [Chloroflexi bacterium]|nr:signal recognition particle-docking protein FtsY [Chloroflexota bacterium]
MLRLLGRNKKTSESSQETRRSWTNVVGGVFRRSQIDTDFWEDLEEALIVADVGVATSMELVEKVQDESKWRGARTPDTVYELLRTEISGMLADDDAAAGFDEDGPVAVMVVGVNGSGKTTSIGKLVQAAKSDGRVPLIAAADTFRAGAISQLEIWAERTDTMFVSSSEGADPGSVVYDALNAAKSRKADFVVIDTAGRLHTAHNLMEELKKMRRILDRHADDFAPRVLLVIDGNTGQNGVTQAKLFSEAVGCDGVILTKLDSTAKGGVILAIRGEMGLPVRYIGTGEGVDDFAVFDPRAFAETILPAA